MSFYNPTASFSRPKVYDPELARRAQQDESSEGSNIASLAERIAEKQRRSLREELGFSDEEDTCSEDEEAKEFSPDDLNGKNMIVSEEYEQLQQRYMTALKDIHEMGEKERKAVEQLSKLKQMSKTQVNILTRNFKDKLGKHEELVEELLQVVQDYETKLADAKLVSEKGQYQTFKTMFEAQRTADLDSPSQQNAQLDTAALSLSQSEEFAVLRKKFDSVNHENSLLRQCLSDLIAGEIPSLVTRQDLSPSVNSEKESFESKEGTSNNDERDQQDARSKNPSAFSSKLNNLSGDALKTKLVKALKVAKTSQTKLAAAEKEKEELLALLSEARAELDKRQTSGATPAPLSVEAPPVPAKPSSLQSVKESKEDGDKSSPSKADKIREKFDKLKKKLVETETECADLKAKLETASAELQALRDAPAPTPEKIDTSPFEEKIQQLEAALNQEKARVQAAKANHSASQQALEAKAKIIKTKFQDELATVRASKVELESMLKTLQKDIVRMVKQVETKVKEKESSLSGIVEKYQREYKERKRLFNLVQELRGNIRVLCRVRPALDFEKDDVVIKFPEDGVVEVKNPKGREKQWEFDHVFKSNTTNEQVFSQVSDLCTSILDGYNVCIFAYGQTGSGKTHTMEGPENDPGVNYRALAQLFENMNQRKNGGEWTFEVQVSLLEIYNEQIRDLLCDKSKQKKLEVKAGKHGMHVPGLTLISVSDHTQVIKLMKLGKKNRAVACTDMNAHSSRSHSMLSTYIVARNCITNEEARGKLHLIDLAGSERISKSGVQGARLAEATNINKSLSALGDVIQARANKQGHVPYRNSTLTYLLQDSLSADSKTLMFVQCSPVSVNAGETVCSLNFAARARQVELGKAAKHVSK